MMQVVERLEKFPDDPFYQNYYNCKEKKNQERVNRVMNEEVPEVNP